MCLLGDKQLIKTAIVVGGVCILSQKSLTKNFHSGVKGSQDRCQDKYNRIWVKPPLFCVGYNNNRKREYVFAMSVFAGRAKIGRVVNRPLWVPETFLAPFPVSASPLVALAYGDRYGQRCDFRPTPKIPTAREKDLWYPGY